MESEVKKNIKDVNKFLKEIKEIDNKFFIILSRKIECEKNPFDFLGKLEYDINDLINEVKNLTYKDYLRCQIDTKNKFKFMYSFIKMINKYIVYIKLSIMERNDKYVYVISFHEALKDEMDLRPYKEGK